MGRVEERNCGVEIVRVLSNRDEGAAVESLWVEALESSNDSRTSFVVLLLKTFLDLCPSGTLLEG